MALLPGIPEVIGKQSEWRDCLISVIGGQSYWDSRVEMQQIIESIPRHFTSVLVKPSPSETSRSAANIAHSAVAHIECYGI
jgi:hypothetical protein